MLTSLNLYALAGLAAACAIAVGSCTYQKHKADALDFALEAQNDAIEAQNDLAAATLDRLTKERDELQGSLNRAAETAKERQSAFDKELDRLRAVAVPGPIRVRVQSCDAGRSGGGAVAPVSPGAQVSAGAETAASGLLSPEAARRTERAMIEVEDLSGDFNKCQDALLARVAVERKR